jgi:hypothetical protein
MEQIFFGKNRDACLEQEQSFFKKNKEQEQSRVCTVTNVAVTMHGTNLFEKKIEMHAWNKNNLFLKNKEQEPSRVCVWCFTFTVHLFF